MADSDVFAVEVTATGAVTTLNQRTRVRGVWVSATVGAGSIELRDGGSGGTVRLKLATVATIANLYVLLPGDGILFRSDVYATLSNATVTLMCG